MTSEPLSSIIIEEKLLGLLLITPQEIPKIINLTVLEDFASPKNQQVYRLIFKLLNLEMKNPDLLKAFKDPQDFKDYDYRNKFQLDNIYEAIKSKEFNLITAGYIDYLLAVSGLSSDLYEYARELRDLQRKRQIEKILKSSLKLMNQQEAPNSTQLSEDFVAHMSQIASQIEETSYEKIDLVTERVHRSLIYRSENAGIQNLSSGYPELDKISEGFDKGELIIIAARPSMGKTSFAMNIAVNCAKRNNNRVLFYSLEMDSEQLVERLLAMISLVESSKFKNTITLSEGDWEAINLAKTQLNNLEIYFDATPNAKLQDLIAKTHREHKIKPFNLIVIDYLQLLNIDGLKENRQNEVSRISRELKALARALKVPLIALAQLSREVEKRSDNRPILSDLRESGAIEQDADKVIFLYRDDYYAKKDNEAPKITISPVEIRVAKNRNGAVGKTLLNFNLPISKFYGNGIS